VQQQRNNNATTTQQQRNNKVFCGIEAKIRHLLFAIVIDKNL